MNDFILGIDIGTTGVKGIVVDSDGKIHYQKSFSCDLLSPQPGFAEEDANVWWENVKALLSEVKDLFKIKAIGVSGMVPTIILVDEKGNPLRNSIQQNDSRAVEEIQYFKTLIDEDEYFKVTGNTINQQVIFPKFLWLKKHEPENVEKTKWIMGSYNFINFKLTNIPNLEKNWALESGLWKLEGGWYDKILEISGISSNLLPKVFEPHEIVGYTTEEVEKLTGFPKGVPVVGGSADHIASAFATGLRQEGDLLLKFGGAGDILFVTERPVIDKRLFIDYHDIPNQFVLNGCMASSGSIVKWFKNEFLPDMSFEDITELSKKLKPGSEKLIMLPYFIGEKTPIFDPVARGVFFGLTLHHKKEHIFRSILEGVAFGYRHHVEVLKDIGFEIKRVFMSNGGAKNELWRQIVADVVGKNAIYVTDHPGSSLGSVFIAGYAIGIFKNWDEIDKFLTNKELVKYNKENHKQYNKYYKIYRKLYDSLRDLFKELYEI